MRSLAALIVSVLALILAGCGGGSDTTVSPAQAAFEDAELVPVGQAAFLRLQPGTADPEQRRILAYMTGGKWLENGLLIPPKEVDAMCRADQLSGEVCESGP
jgi:hypothetical protein